jgi:hypothetical protein
MPLNLLTTINWQISTVDTVGYPTWPSLAFGPGGQPSIAYWCADANSGITRV